MSVEHVGVGVDHSRQHRRLAEIDHLGAGGNLELRFRPDIGDALALQQYHLLREHLAGLAVEQLAGADSHDLRRRRTFIGGTLAPEARRRPCAPPWSSGPCPFLRPQRGRKCGRSQQSHHRRFQSGSASHRVILRQEFEPGIVDRPGMRILIHRCRPVVRVF
jgi:hypothetical protein